MKCCFGARDRAVALGHRAAQKLRRLSDASTATGGSVQRDLPRNDYPLPADHALVNLLGDTLVSGGTAMNTVSTFEALGGKSAIALYFSAHWCPPCRHFTPVFAQNYVDNLRDQGLEVVFVSSDRDEASFKEYYGSSHPWLALPFEKRELKQKLSQKLGVSGIPSVVILDAFSGKVVNANGRQMVSEDPMGKQLPWKAPTLKDVLGTTFTSKNGDSLELSSLAGGYFGLYFSAHWCPPCRMFTPQLVQAYNKIKWNNNGGTDRPFEIVFCSSDRDQNASDAYYKDMPWARLPFADRKRHEQISQALDISGLPTLVMLKVHENGRDVELVNPDASSMIRNVDGTGELAAQRFPFQVPAVQDLDKNEGTNIDKQLSVVILAERANNSAEGKDKFLERLLTQSTPLAEEYLERARASDENPEVRFYISGSSNAISARIRKFCGLPDEAQPGKVIVIVTDISGGMKFYQCVSLTNVSVGEVTRSAITELLSKVQYGQLVAKSMSPRG